MESHQMESKKEIIRVTLIGLVWNIILSLIKFVSGIMGHSQAIVADAVHSLSDCITDISILIGAKYWSRPADESHPYGHHKIETLVTIFIGILLFIAAFSLCYNGIVNIRNKNTSPPGVIALIAALISLLSKEILYRWTIKKGNQLKSSALFANALHHRSDGFSSIPATIAVLGAMIFPEFGYLDQIGAIAVSIFLFKYAYAIIKPALFQLADSSASRELTKEIHKIAMSFNDIKEVHCLRSRYVGPYIHLDLHIKVEPEISVKDAYTIIKKLKKTLYEKHTNITNIVVQSEPY